MSTAYWSQRAATAELGVKSYCGYQTRRTQGVMIAEHESATNLCTERLDPIDWDHIELAKPEDRNATLYVALREALRHARRSAQVPTP